MAWTVAVFYPGTSPNTDQHRTLTINLRTCFILAYVSAKYTDKLLLKIVLSFYLCVVQ